MEKYVDDKLLSVLRDDEKMEKFFENFDGEKLKNFLTYIHSRALKIDFEKDGFVGQDMIVSNPQEPISSFVSPPQVIQQKALKNIAKSIKNIPGRRNKAILLHYLENQLHLFSDGNGRTGRSILELFLNDDFDFDESEVCKHNDSNIAKISTEKLEQKYGIEEIERATAYGSYVVYRSLLNAKMLPEELNEVCVLSALNQIDFYTKKDCSYINPKVKKQLSAEQAYKIARCLADNSTLSFSPSALGIFIMKKRLNQSIEFGTKYDVSETKSGEEGFDIAILGFDIDDEKTFENWGKEEYLLTREIYNRIKEMYIDAMLDIFEKPENFKFNKDTTILDALDKRLYNNISMPKVIIRSWKNTEINLDGTRTQEHLDNLVNFLGKEHPLENIEEPISVQELCEHTLQQQIDYKGKDEFRQLESKLTRLEADLNRAESKSL